MTCTNWGNGAKLLPSEAFRVLCSVAHKSDGNSCMKNKKELEKDVQILRSFSPLNTCKSVHQADNAF